MKAVILSEDPEAKFDEVEQSFIKGQYQATIKYASDRKDKADEQKKVAKDAQKTDAGGDDQPDAEKSRQDSMKKIHNLSRGIKDEK